MLYLAIGQLIHEERQREIEHELEMRRLLEPADETPWSRIETRTTSDELTRVSSRHEAAGAAS